MAEENLHRAAIVACLWDFDKTLIDGYMQSPLFRHYGVEEKRFWEEVSALPGAYEGRGGKVQPDTAYLNHILTYTRAGLFNGLNNALLRELGGRLEFYPGLPGFFNELKALARSKPEYVKHGITLEHYIISTGLSEIIRGSAIAPHVEGVFGCEFIENPLPPDYLRQTEIPLAQDAEIAQIGQMADNTVKTRFLFEINKGSNKSPEIDVNAKIAHEDRRIPIKNMIYVADGPSDIPMFSVVKRYGGKTCAVYNPRKEEEFAQNDSLLQAGRIHAYGPADYTPASSTYLWIKMHVLHICDRIIEERRHALASRLARPPRHLHQPDTPPPAETNGPEQATFLEE